MIDYITGSSGFLGSRLMQKLPDAVSVSHEAIHEEWFTECGRIFFLSAYGNMADHTSRGGMIQANVCDVILTINKMHSDLGLFVFASSSSVNLPVQTPYSRTKRAAEEILLASGLPVCIVRPFSIVGVGEQPQHLIPTLIRSCMEGEPMPFVPDATHDFIDVDDVVDGMIWLADNKATGVFEFGSGKPTSNNEVRGIVEAVCGKSANITEIQKLRDYDSPAWYCQKPDWMARKSLAASIEEMVKAYQHDRK